MDLKTLQNKVIMYFQAQKNPNLKRQKKGYIPPFGLNKYGFNYGQKDLSY